MELILTRKYYSKGTNGTICKEGSIDIICHTIELPWQANQKKISCIPEGRYALKMRFSERFSLHIQLLDVKDRSLILIHPANDALKELRGCIAPVSRLTGQGKGSASVAAFTRLKNEVVIALQAGPVFITIKSDDHDNQTKG